MSFESNPYRPSLLFRHAHINTIYPSLYRSVKDPNYTRVTLNTSDGDFIDIDCKFQSSEKSVILCHGLEGSSQSKYMIATAHLLYEKGWDVLCMNYRGCSGRINKGLEMYHAGRTDDLHLIIQELTDSYSHISIVGFSLGGNMVLKYCGDKLYPLDSRIKSVVSVSSPLDLGAGGKEISKLKNWLYDNRFVKELKRKVIAKAKQFPAQIDLSIINKIKTLYQFDDQITAPIHGFKDANNYYEVNSAKQFLKNIDIPCLILQAKDDPFLSSPCYPKQEAKANKNITHLLPKHGGHLGFYTPNSEYYWDEYQISNFIESIHPTNNQ